MGEREKGLLDMDVHAEHMVDTAEQLLHQLATLDRSDFACRMRIAAALAVTGGFLAAQILLRERGHGDIADAMRERFTPALNADD